MTDHLAPPREVNRQEVNPNGRTVELVSKADFPDRMQASSAQAGSTRSVKPFGPTPTAGKLDLESANPK